MSGGLPLEPANPERLDLEELTALQPGLARLMPEVGARMWKCYYAAQARNWPFAAWQLGEMRKLLRLCTITRPKYRRNLEDFIQDDLGPLRAAIEAEDPARFRAAFFDAVDSGNDYHRRWKKPWIIWKLPAFAPPDLDLTPQPEE